MFIVKDYLIALLLMAGIAISLAQFTGQDLSENVNSERDRRAIDFGLFVRNLLLKSATASNAKANISRNVLNLKTATPAPRRRTTTTTTTAVPFFFNKGPFKFPFELSAPINSKFNGGGYLNFDYDYGSQQPVRPARRRRPTTTSTTTTTTAATPAATPALPPRRRPIPRRPFGFLGKQKLPFYDYYYDDYDYNYDEANNAPASAAPSPSPAPTPMPPTARPQKRPATNRVRAQGRAPPLRNRLIYKFRQPVDTSTNNNNDDDNAVQQPQPQQQQPATADGNSQQSPPNTNGNNNSNNNDETSTNANDDGNDVTYDDADNDDDNAYPDNAVLVTDNNNNLSDANNANNEQDFNDSSDNVNSNINQNPNNINVAPPTPSFAAFPKTNFNFNGNVPQVQGVFGNPGGFGNFADSAGFQYSPPYNNFNPQYQASAPTGYSVRYY